MSIPTIGDRGHFGPTPVQVANTRTQQPHAEVFHKIKKRTSEDRTHKKMKLKNVRVFDEPITKKKTSTAIEKENRSLNVAARIRALNYVLSSEGFTPDQVRLIAGEYKAKLKEEEPQVTGAASFVDYMIAKQSRKLTLEQNVLIDKLVDLRENRVFEQLDREHVFRYAGVEKAVYCFETLAVLTARQAASAKALETEYEMTVDLRVNQMQRVLQSLLLQTKPPRGLTAEIVTRIVSDYKQALETNPDVENARAFFEIYQHDYNLEGINISGLAQQIDDNLAGLDISRKRHVQDGAVYYTSKKAECDLGAFLAGNHADKPGIEKLSLDQLVVFLECFDKIKESMKKSNLLHGDIKPDNILIYKEVGPNGEIFYIPKISDYGKSKLGTTPEIYQIHTGNARFHKGAYDTFETQGDSLDVIKLLVLNSGFKHLTKKIKDEESFRSTTLAGNGKIADVLESPLGLYIYKKGLKKNNYFSNLSSSWTSRSWNAVASLSPETRKDMLANTVDATVKFLHGIKAPSNAKLAKLSIKELEEIETETLKILQTLKLLGTMGATHKQRIEIQEERRFFKEELLVDVRKALAAARKSQEAAQRSQEATG